MHDGDGKLRDLPSFGDDQTVKVEQRTCTTHSFIYVAEQGCPKCQVERTENELRLRAFTDALKTKKHPNT